jgi:hypothetical protein
MTTTTVPQAIAYPQYQKTQQWQYEHIVIAGQPESAEWADRHRESYARSFATNPALSTGRIRSRVVTVKYADKKDWTGTVISTTPWVEETVDQSTFDPMTAGAA